MLNVSGITEEQVERHGERSLFVPGRPSLLTLKSDNVPSVSTTT